MLRLNQKRRAALGETLRQLANLAAAALIFGQFAAQRAFSIVFLVVGITVWSVLVAVGLWLAGGNQDG